MSQTVKVNVDRNTVKQTINIIKHVFYKYHEQLKHRTPLQQNTIGDVLTTLEMDLKKRFNDAASTGSFDCDIELVYKLEYIDREIERATENLLQ